MIAAFDPTKLPVRPSDNIRHETGGGAELDWNAIGVVGEILGAIALVITLIYFGRQIFRANRISTATGARELQQMFTHLYTLIATNPDIRALVTRMQDPDYTVRSAEEK